MAYFINPSQFDLSSCVFILSLLGNGSVNTFPRNEHTQKYINFWTRHFLCGPCRIKGESAGLSVYPHIVAKQQPVKMFPRHEELLEASFSVWSMSYQKESGLSVLLINSNFPTLVFPSILKVVFSLFDNVVGAHQVLVGMSTGSWRL
jgi:hypothetical protein